jgi:hypothetical protein
VNGTFAKSVPGLISLDYMSISGSTAVPARTWYAGSHSIDGGGNKGWVFKKKSRRNDYSIINSRGG